MKRRWKQRIFRYWISDRDAGPANAHEVHAPRKRDHEKKNHEEKEKEKSKIHEKNHEMQDLQAK